MKKPINEKALEISLRLLDQHDKQMKLIEEMVKSVEARRTTIQEFIRANYTGDDYAYKLLKECYRTGQGTMRRIYDNGAYDHVQTRMLVKAVREKYPVTVDQSTEGRSDEQGD